MSYSIEDRNFLDGIKDDIIERLKEREGQEAYACDLGMILTESENVNGSWYCNAYKAEQDIKEHWDVFGGAFAYMQSETGYSGNPLTDSERFHCAAMINLYDLTYQRMLSEADLDGNDRIEITPGFIEKMNDSKEKVDISDTLEWYEQNRDER